MKQWATLKESSGLFSFDVAKTFPPMLIAEISATPVSLSDTMSVPILHGRVGGCLTALLRKSLHSQTYAPGIARCNIAHYMARSGIHVCKT